MTQPSNSIGRPRTPAPGTAAPELRIARLRSHARRLFWSALVLIGVAGATAYYYDNLPAPYENWMLLTAAGLLVLLLTVIPYLVWLSHTWTITTRRVIERSGPFGANRREISHVRGYAIQMRRGILQRMWGAGTLSLSNGVEPVLRLKNIPHAALVHETLVDQVEVNQILAHRDAQTFGSGAVGGV
ncbi:PH domain-containing protein [Microbacterium sp. 20-116]|uniref:PH domain-containing protein n=1 Tax=unclassified Microbacterium TaxID=2609290 RepID=UPI002271BA2F|nr:MULTISPECIES: PH domain-containing protein [unclassified Microbacterium]MDQ1177106.1 membrane protein YdbS with pleckstrin-like domain [Microbacterium sp. SORGH_AS_0421]WAC67888.1 PH domain-containing protein [Microbacterium sp. SL75]